MRIKRILYFLDFPNAFGGAASTLLKQAFAVKEHMSNVLVTIPIDGDGNVVDEFSMRCKEYGLPYSFQKYSVSISAELIDVIGLLEDYDNIVKYIEDFRPDLVHSTQINVCVEMACRKLKVPHIMNVYQCKEHIFSMEYPDIFPHYHICDSQFYLRKWKKRLNLKSICIRNPCNEIVAIKEKRPEPVLICVGEIGERKNQWELLKAVHQLILEENPAYLYLIGNADSNYGKRCKEYIDQNNLGEWVKVYGYIPFAEIEIAKSEALICSSKNESFPNVIETAMACKTIVISTPVAGVPEILKDGENAYISSGFDSEDIYLAIKKFYYQRGMKIQEKLLENAFQTYLDEFSKEAVAEKLLSYYEFVKQDYGKGNNSYLSLENILNEYNSFKQLFEKHETVFMKSNKVKYMIWLIPYIKKSLHKTSYKDLIIWGAGVYGADAIKFAEIFFPELRIRCIIDQNVQGEYFGYPIFNSKDANWSQCMVWIAFLYEQMEAIQIMFKMGLEYHKDFFFLAPINL